MRKREPEPENMPNPCSLGMRKSAVTIASAEALDVPCQSRCSCGGCIAFLRITRMRDWSSYRACIHSGSGLDAVVQSVDGDRAGSLNSCNGARASTMSQCQRPKLTASFALLCPSSSSGKSKSVSPQTELLTTVAAIAGSALSEFLALPVLNPGKSARAHTQVSNQPHCESRANYETCGTVLRARTPHARPGDTSARMMHDACAAGEHVGSVQVCTPEPEHELARGLALQELCRSERSKPRRFQLLAKPASKVQPRNCEEPACERFERWGLGRILPSGPSELSFPKVYSSSSEFSGMPLGADTPFESVHKLASR